MIERIAGQLATTIKTANPERTSSVEVLKFSLIIVLNAISIVLLTMALGLVTGTFSETLLVLGGFAFLRFFSGGLHLSSSEWCVVVSTAVLAVIPHLPLDSYSVWLNGISLAIMLFFAPAKVEEHHRIAQSKTVTFKIICICIVASNFALGSEVLAKTFFVQSLLLLPYKKKEVKSQ
ncbi:accessory gene regulator B family protein [Paenibacillus sp. GYB004]|uniref:accessory gene regulator ArgB-like protein n=1 Tax=Paenibacillus sp. GYB004 TaxID=2994393 RepID=UPI002F96C455